jgi:hypothetical protein
MHASSSIRLAALAVVVGASSAAAQGFTTQDPVIRKIWSEGMDRSQVVPLAQALLDSIGPRLTGSPAIRSGNDWLVSMYKRWGISARNEPYGTWRSWRRGVSHVDLLKPRVRSLEATMLAWSPGTGGKDVTAGTVIIPQVADSAAFVAWLPNVKGKFVLVSMEQPTCRPDDNWKEFATPESFEKMKSERDSMTKAWAERVRATGYSLSLGTGTLGRRLEQAGAVGVIANRWSNGWGVDKVFDNRNERVPAIDMSCEDYGLLYRLTERNQGPVLRVNAESEALGEQPVANTIAEIRGSEKPNEYVMLSAHFDSWDAGSGATDNGTGTVTMLEAMRILKAVLPNPKRTIIVGHWSGEEQGLNGSRGFAAAHPEVVRGMQALFNQDNGTGRVSNISAQGLTGAGAFLARWGAQLPTEISRHISWTFPGFPSGGGSDNASFICGGAPAFGLGSNSWDYGTYTWHTNRDTYDKIVWDDLRNNATLAAMLAYLASEDPETVPRDQRAFVPGATESFGGQRFPAPSGWPACAAPLTNSSQYKR